MPDMKIKTQSNEVSGTGASSSHDMKNYSRATVTLIISQAQGTTRALDLVLQHSPDNSTWSNMFKENLQGLFKRMSAEGQQTILVTKFSRYVRALWEVSGTGSPSFTFTVTAVAN